MLGWRVAPHLGGLELHNFLTLALLPGILLFALGMRPQELALTPPRRGTLAATLACLVVPFGFIVWGFAGNGLTVVALALLLLHNLLSNGFSEEFFARGMVFSQLRARLPNDWALMAQGLVFALVHAGGTFGEEHGNPLRTIANVVALNFPMGVALGAMAVRSRSLVMPVVVHVSLDTMKDLLFWH
jgi:membrane protease YdiL (CAAX protease family)